MKAISQFLGRERLWPVLVLLVGALVILPGLGDSGFWEPQEIRVADKAMKRAGLAEDDNPDKKKAAKAADKDAKKAATASKNKKKTLEDVRPPLTEWSVAQSMKRVGTGGFGARLPLALLGLIALLATFFLGQRLSSARAGLLSALILLSFPLFVWQSRQLISHMGAIAGSALVMLGLVGLAWPVGVRPRPRQTRDDNSGSASMHALTLFGKEEHRAWMYAVDVALVAAGAVLCYYASAALLGLVAPFGAMGLACVGALVGKLHIERDSACSVQPRRASDRQWLAIVGLVILVVTAVAAAVAGALVERSALAILVAPALVGVILVAAGMSQSRVRHRLSFDARWRQWHLLAAGLCALGIALAALFAVLAAVFELRDPIPGERALFGHSIVPVSEPLDILGGRWSLHDVDGATFDVLFEQLAFGLFPWVALAPIAVTLVAMGLQRGRRTWAGYVLFAWVALAWVVCAVMARKVEQVVFPALAPIAVAIGMWLDGLLDARDQADATTESERDARDQFGMPLRQPLVAMFAAFATVALAANILAFPEKFLSVHVAGESIAYPKGAGTEILKIKLSQWVAVLGIGVGLALAVGLFLWASHRRVGGLPRLLFAVRRYGIHAAVTIGLLYSLFLAHVWLPTLSAQFSTKEIFARYHALRQDGDLLALMGQYGSAPKYYIDGDYEKLAGRHQIVQFMKKDERVFALVPSSDQCSLHRSFKAGRKSVGAGQAGASDGDREKPYYVLAQNAKSLLLSNRLKQGEVDKNRLSTAIVKSKPADIGTPMKVNYDNRIELIGVKMPAQVSRGSSFKMTLFYRVLKSVNGKWKVFVHFDPPSNSRFQGDHEPIGGLCATSFWQAGDYIVDTFEVEAGNITYPRTAYNVHVGFFQGSHGNWKNMKVVSADGERGPLTVDDADRVKIGRVILK